jgi:multimeric flavodoxin WrbA
MIMKLLAVNGSPRKKWNTATLLEKVLEGAASQGATTRLIHLYDLQYQGCVSCYACKTIGGKSYGRCAVKDDLSPILEEILTVDAFVLGSPIYLGALTGGMQSFFERLVYPYLEYTNPPSTLFPKKIPTAFIYTMGADEERIKQFGFDRAFGLNEMFLKVLFGNSETLCSYDTYQFDDYKKIYAPMMDHEKKAQRREEIFPEDCRRAFDIGVRLAHKR